MWRAPCISVSLPQVGSTDRAGFGDRSYCQFITLAASSGKHNVTVRHSGVRQSVRLFVCPVGILTAHDSACDAVSIHFGPTIKKTNILSYIVLEGNSGVSKSLVLPSKTHSERLPLFTNGRDPSRRAGSSATLRLVLACNRRRGKF